MWDFDFPGWLNWVFHSLSVTAIVGALSGFFPPIAALVAIIYYLLQIWRDPTVQNWIQYRRQRKIAKYEEELKILREKISRAVTKG